MYFYSNDSEMDKQKSTLLDAYVRKAIALGKLVIIDQLQNNQKISGIVNVDAFNEIHTQASMFIDCTDLKVIPNVVVWPN